MTTLTKEGRALFLELIDLPESERAERLTALRDDTPALADEVAALLAADAEAEGFLEPPAIVGRQEEDDPSAHWLVGRRIGRYTIEARIGVGGMGTVYVAEQDRPRRKVALKLLRTSWATPNLRRRFEREVEILGKLRHPGIAEIYEAGTHDSELGPVPYFALEYIADAKSVTKFAADAELDVRARVDLLAKVCDAVAEAHEHGIVHRDIKPSNVLVGSDGAPKLIDFGIARWLDDPDAAGTIATQLGDLLGTLHYMSPEQFDGSGPGPTAQSDVYSLGVVAYELVAGRMPYPISHSNAARISEIVRTHVPEPLMRAKVGWRALDDVVQMALAKAPGDRYANAAELAEDLRRAASGEPVRARRSLRIHRLRTWAWRSRRALPWVAAGAIATAVVIASRPDPEDDARDAEADPGTIDELDQDQDYRFHVTAAERALAANDLARAKVELDACGEAERGWEWHRLAVQIDRSLDAIDLGSPVHVLLRDPARGILVATTDDGHVHGLRAEGASILRVWDVTIDDELNASTIDPSRGLAYVGGASGLVHRFRIDDGTDAGEFGTRTSGVGSIALWNGEIVIARRKGTIERWDPDALTMLSTAKLEHEVSVLTPAGDSVLAAWNSWGVDDIDPRTGAVLRTFAATEGIEAILLDGDTLYVSGWDDRITALDRSGGAKPRAFEAEPDGIVDLVQPDAGTIVSAGRDGAIAIWDVGSGTVRERLRGHDFGVDALSLDAEGRWLASASLDGTVRTWDLHAPPIDRVLGGAADKIQAVAFAGDRVVAAIGPQWGKLDNDEVRAWSIGSGEAIATVSDHAVTVDAIAVARDGTTIATASRDGIVQMRNAADLAMRVELRASEGPVRALAFVDDKTIATGSEGGTVMRWSSDGRELDRRDAGVGAIADCVVTKRGLVVGGEAGLAIVGDASVHPLGAFTGITALALVSDDALALGHADGTLTVIDLADASKRWSAPTFGRSITDVAVAPDGSRIATSSQDYRIRLHDARTGDFLLTVGAHESVATSVAFSPDGRTIASGGYDRVVRLWHAPTSVTPTTRR